MEIIHKNKNLKTVSELNVGEVFRIVDFDSLGLFMVLEDYDYVVDLENNLMLKWEWLQEDIYKNSNIEDIDNAEVKVYNCQLILTD